MSALSSLSAGSSAFSVNHGFTKLFELLKKKEKWIRLTHCESSVPSFLLAQLIASVSSTKELLQKPLWVITSTEEQAFAIYQDLQFFLESVKEPFSLEEDSTMVPKVLFFPELQNPWAEVAPDHRSMMQRMSVLFRLSQGLSSSIVVSSISSFSRRVMPRKAFTSLIDLLQVEQEIDREATLSLLGKGGYNKMPICEDPGTFAVHGGVLDLFIPLYSLPIRLELFGDLIESMRFYDPSTQRTLRSVSELFIHPIKETLMTPGNRLEARLWEAAEITTHPSARTNQMVEQLKQGEDFFGVETLTPAFHEYMASLEEYLPSSKVLFLQEPYLIQDRFFEQLLESEKAYETSLHEKKLAFPPHDFYLNPDELTGLWTSQNTTRIETSDLVIQGETTNSVENVYEIPIASQNHKELKAELYRTQAHQTDHLLLPWIRQMREQLEDQMRVIVLVPNLSHGERMVSLLQGYEIKTHLYRPGISSSMVSLSLEKEENKLDLLSKASHSREVEIRIGALSAGFTLPLDGVALYTENELFGEKLRRTHERAKPKKKPRLGDLAELEIGSYVVHDLHGVGQYQGLKKLPLQGIEVDFVYLQYEGGTLYLPVWRIHEIQRYVGAEGTRPKIDKLGGETWQKTKAKVSKDIQKLAEELLQLYAQRQAMPGISHRLNDSSQQIFAEFEAMFPFEETPDQQRAIDEVLVDLDEGKPMDRLICGDVGYGKTEVALRAIMKVVLSGYQVAVLAPTTVLVEQHAARFRERFSGLPVHVHSLSRFRSKTEQTEVIKKLAEGRIDVVVGTHRLLSADVRFKNLGLLVIDEEQRFGVAHKERLRTLRSHVDTLTLTATPIPRTLHMALSGMREISMITTPPEDRLSIRTTVARESDDLIREGIQKELKRGGQVFFVHNRVETLPKWKNKLAELIPGLRLVMGHGQMSAEELEQVMLDFTLGKADVLLSTTIIESGLDIPRANTMFVDRADTFGLSQLYQMRGRIGRSKERAFCYLLVPPANFMTKEAKQRIAVLQRFSDLGSGFQIASHDLEIRGAGELLGDKQSGTIAAVGFDMYTQMLEEAVAEMKGQPIKKRREPELTSDLPGFIPDTYVFEPSQRLEFYQRFSFAENEEEILQVLQELADRYGEVPEEVKILVDLMMTKVVARQLAALTLEISQSRLALSLADDTPLQPEQVLKLVSASKSPWRLTKDMRLIRQFTSEQERKERLFLSKSLLLDLWKKTSS